MPEKTITVTPAVEEALATIAKRVEHEAGCATEADFSATCTCGLSDALNVIEAALATPSQEEQPRCCGHKKMQRVEMVPAEGEVYDCPGCIDCQPVGVWTISDDDGSDEVTFGSRGLALEEVASRLHCNWQEEGETATHGDALVQAEDMLRGAAEKPGEPDSRDGCCVCFAPTQPDHLPVPEEAGGSPEWCQHYSEATIEEAHERGVRCFQVLTEQDTTAELAVMAAIDNAAAVLTAAIKQSEPEPPAVPEHVGADGAKHPAILSDLLHQIHESLADGEIDPASNSELVNAWQALSGESVPPRRGKPAPDREGEHR